MIENDDREEHNGYKRGDKVLFRWNRLMYRGQIVRLTNSKAAIRFMLNDEEVVKYVSYRQIDQKDG